MGRNKIKIEKIQNEKVRQITFLKRKKGLLKKAMELSLLCDSTILLYITDNSSEKPLMYSSKANFTEILNSLKTPKSATTDFFTNDEFKEVSDGTIFKTQKKSYGSEASVSMEHELNLKDQRLKKSSFFNENHQPKNENEKESSSKESGNKIMSLFGNNIYDECRSQKSECVLNNTIYSAPSLNEKDPLEYLNHTPFDSDVFEDDQELVKLRNKLKPKKTIKRCESYESVSLKNNSTKINKSTENTFTPKYFSSGYTSDNMSLHKDEATKQIKDFVNQHNQGSIQFNNLNNFNPLINKEFLGKKRITNGSIYSESQFSLNKKDFQEKKNSNTINISSIEKGIETLQKLNLQNLYFINTQMKVTNGNLINYQIKNSNIGVYNWTIPKSNGIETNMNNTKENF